MGIWLLGSDACTANAHLLQVNYCFRELGLSFNGLGDMGPVAAGKRALAPGLQTPEAVVSVLLRIGDRSIVGMPMESCTTTYWLLKQKF